MPYYYEGVANSEEEDKIQHEAFYNAVEEQRREYNAVPSATVGMLVVKITKNSLL